MDNDFVHDKFSGCLLGLAIGDALGAPADGLTFLQVISKFHAPIAMFYPYPASKAGQYTRETAIAMNLAMNAFKEGKYQESFVTESTSYNDAKLGYEPSMGGRTAFSNVVPLGLASAALGSSLNEVAAACKTMSFPRMRKTDTLATFLFAITIMEVIRNAEELKKPYELYDADKSLLARLIDICFACEQMLPADSLEPGEIALSEYLGYVRKKLMSMNFNLLSMNGALGVGTGFSESLSFALYAYLSAPDDFSTIPNAVSYGGPASLRGAMVGALVGATMGDSLLPSDMKDQVDKGPTIQSKAIAFAKSCLPAEIEAEEPIENGETENAVSGAE